MTDRPLLPISFYCDKETDEVVFVYPEERTERIPVGEMIERIRPRTLSELLDPYRGVYKLTPKQKAIFISEGATNGDVIKAMFPNAEYDYHEKSELVDAHVTVSINNCDTWQDYSMDWWNAPYKESEAAEQ